MNMLGCAGQPHIRPPNELNEPVFHATRYFSMGAAGGQTVSRNDDLRIFGPVEDPLWSLYFQPVFIFDIPVSRWAGYSGLPVYWNFLLTGEQYADTTHLLSGKWNIAAHGGIAGISYSQRTGWEVPANLEINFKRTIGTAFFLDGEIGAETFHIRHPERRREFTGLGFGWQATERNSFKLESHFDAYRLSPAQWIEERAMKLRGDDYLLSFSLRHSYYARGNSVGPEIRYGFRNGEPKDALLEFGLAYAYRFR